MVKREFVMAKPGFLPHGFLLIELMVAILIGLVLISALMRMQSTLLELRETFCVRGSALALALDFLERDDTHRAKQNGVPVKFGQREFMVNCEKNEQNGSSAKVRVEWLSVVGKKRCLEI